MDMCDSCQYNPQIVDRIKNQLPDDETTLQLAEMFKVFGDNTRIRILWTLFDKELCVYDIADSLKMSQSAISHQLKTLKQARLIKSRRDGKNAFYSIDDDHVKKIIEQMLIHIEEQ
ncbi:MAG: helix-turn-helix transcriptional regulator [Oscillospiraceae bacterium]|nr:helix-turn-helix transcriptional regulator [Oscillospiraceae bacterium]